VSKTTVLATGRITGAEIITITHVKWSDSPPVVMIRWPGQPSLTDPSRLPAVASELMAIMAAANAKLDAIQRQPQHSGRKNHGARSRQAPSWALNHSELATMPIQERHFPAPGHEECSGQEKPSIDQGLTVNRGHEETIGSAASS
jgi:hypothetical protein